MQGSAVAALARPKVGESVGRGERNVLPAAATTKAIPSMRGRKNRDHRRTSTCSGNPRFKASTLPALSVRWNDDFKYTDHGISALDPAFEQSDGQEAKCDTNPHRPG